jgi:hypothetical protein
MIEKSTSENALNVPKYMRLLIIYGKASQSVSNQLISHLLFVPPYTPWSEPSTRGTDDIGLLTLGQSELHICYLGANMQPISGCHYSNLTNFSHPGT